MAIYIVVHLLFQNIVAILKGFRKEDSKCRKLKMDIMKWDPFKQKSNMHDYNKQ